MATLVRDRVTWLIYSQLAVYGYFVYGFGPSVLLLRDDQQVSRTVSGLHGTALATGAVLAGLVGARLVRRWGRALVLRVGLSGLAVGVLVFSSATALPVTLVGALVAGTFGALMLNTDSAVLSDHHGDAGSAAISEANALAASTGLLAPLVIGGVAATSLGWRPGFALAAVLALVLLLASARVAVPRPAIHHVDTGPVAAAGSGTRASRLPRRYWVAWAVLVLCISTEFSMTIWAADLLRQQAGLSAGAAAGSLSALIAGIAIGRVVGGRLALRRTPESLLAGSLGITAAGFLLFWSATTPWLALPGLLVMGLGIAVQFPLSVARAIAAAEGRPDQATARLSIGAGLAIGGAPFLLGFMADQFGTRRAFLIVPVLLVLAAAGLWAGRPRRARVDAG
ncbi:MAG: MFS transporter [Geodermatophilaceae bacterium]